MDIHNFQLSSVFQQNAKEYTSCDFREDNLHTGLEVTVSAVASFL